MITDLITNYFSHGYYINPIAYDVIGAKGNVFLIHGWGVRAVSMSKLTEALAGEGYRCFNYDYPTSEHPILEHAKIFLDLYRKLIKECSIEGKIFFVTHSMGGLILRAAMNMMTVEECQQIEAIVMLGPPNKGSKWASIGKWPFIRKKNLSLGDMILGANSIACRIPNPAYRPPTGIVAGMLDGKVAYQDTSLPDGWEFERVRVFCTHFGLRNPKRTLNRILQFLNNKHFK